MKILDRFFYYLYSFSRKYRDTNDHIGANVLITSILLSFNILGVLNLIDILSKITISIPKAFALALTLIVYGICSIYFYRKKRYLKIIRTYGKKTSNRYVNSIMMIYVFISIASVFIIGLIRLSYNG